MPGSRQNEVSSSGAGEQELAELRRLLLAPAQADLAAQQKRLEQVETRQILASEVSRVLPEAVALRASQDDHLARALETTVGESLRKTVQRDPQPIADALFPIFGPAIRKSIREALREVLESINRTIEHSLSVQSWRWRMEAWQTGKPLSEIVMRHTLQFRVEQVFLIDEGTGLPMQHVVADTVAAQDSALISGMLTAIQDFAEDSFGTEEGETLATMQVGELLVWIEQGPQAMLATVIRGVPVPELRIVLKDIIETIHLQYGLELERFEGDPEPLVVTRPVLEEALLVQYGQKEKGLRPVWLLAGALALLLGVGAFLSFRSHRQWDAYIALLRAEPGLIVTEEGRTGGRWSVEGLRDPLARDPAALLAQTALSADDVQGLWHPYQALDSTLVVQRAVQQLAAPASVVFSYREGMLTVTGVAPPSWIETARVRAPLLAGVTSYDDSGLDNSARQQVAALAQSIEQTTLQFTGGSTQLSLGQEAVLDSLAARIAQLGMAADAANTTTRVQILGHVSSEGTERFNQVLSRRRAEQMRDLLIRRGIAADQVEVIGTGTPRADTSEQTEADRALNRSVTFRVVTSEE